MTNRLKPLARLKGDQLRASSPLYHAALSASAGTGKTHVLSARVLRLLLAGVDPSSILCLTFTKAGAAEMARWLRLERPIVMAVGTGRTLKAAIDHLPPISCRQHCIVSLTGNVGPDVFLMNTNARTWASQGLMRTVDDLVRKDTTAQDKNGTT